jgi:hypothetical protein
VAQRASARTGDAERVGLVDDEDGTVPAADFGHVGQRGGVAEHRVDALDEDHCPAGATRPEGMIDGVDVVVRDDLDRGAGEPAGVDQGGVHMGVGNDQRVAIGERRDHGQVRVVAGGEDQRGREAGELSQLPLHLGMEGQGSADQPGGGRASTEALGRRNGGGNHASVLGEAEIVVARQVDQRCRPVRLDQVAGQTQVCLPGGLGGQPLLERAHAWTCAMAATIADVIVVRSSAVQTYGGMV